LYFKENVRQSYQKGVDLSPSLISSLMFIFLYLGRMLACIVINKVDVDLRKKLFSSSPPETPVETAGL
jgi:hypothetical protein